MPLRSLPCTSWSVCKSVAEIGEEAAPRAKAAASEGAGRRQHQKVRGGGSIRRCGKEAASEGVGRRQHQKVWGGGIIRRCGGEADMMTQA